jgi:isopenicillin N synthase-like dioxygenase
MAEVWLRYYREMERLSADLLRLFAMALQLDHEFFADKIHYHRSSLRALNYPEQPADAKPLPGQLRAGVHTDYGSITILLQDAVGGLQVSSRQGEWQDVPYIPDSYVINLGDLVSFVNTPYPLSLFLISVYLLCV